MEIDNFYEANEFTNHLELIEKIEPYNMDLNFNVNSKLINNSK